MINNTDNDDSNDVDVIDGHANDDGDNNNGDNNNDELIAYLNYNYVQLEC